MHDHKIKTHVPTPPTGVDPTADVNKAMHMHGQIAAGHYKQLPTTQKHEVVDGKKRIYTTVGVEEVDTAHAPVASPV